MNIQFFYVQIFKSAYCIYRIIFHFQIKEWFVSLRLSMDTVEFIYYCNVEIDKVIDKLKLFYSYWKSFVFKYIYIYIIYNYLICVLKLLQIRGSMFSYIYWPLHSGTKIKFFLIEIKSINYFSMQIAFLYN